MPSSKKENGSSSGQVSHRLRNFFRMNSSASSASEKDKDKSGSSHNLSVAVGSGGNGDMPSPKPSRHTKFFSNPIGRLRAHTVASEGNQLDEAMSPTAHANPYFAHQGQPGLRHHNDGSVPPSPPDTPELKVCGPDGEKATSETKEELARRLRRVASAPNAQGLFIKGQAQDVPSLPTGERPATAELGKDPLLANGQSGILGLVDSSSKHGNITSDGDGLDSTSSTEDVLLPLPAPSTSLAFRRTYSSNSIKVRNVEVGPASFDKIKLIGKGDVGKVYLVREKKSSRLYAMKGELKVVECLILLLTAKCSP